MYDICNVAHITNTLHYMVCDRYTHVGSDCYMWYDIMICICKCQVWCTATKSTMYETQLHDMCNAYVLHTAGVSHDIRHTASFTHAMQHMPGLVDDS